MKNITPLSKVVFSPCKTYRYALWRTWNAAKPTAMFIGLNPSCTAANEDNPTIRRCVGFAQDWGYGGICLVNLFAYRADTPAMLRSAIEPVGADNDQWLRSVAEKSGIIIGAWGNDGSYLNRSSTVRSMFHSLHCLKINKSGEPAHPLYQPKAATPIPLPTPTG